MPEKKKLHYAGSKVYHSSFVCQKPPKIHYAKAMQIILSFKPVKSATTMKNTIILPTFIKITTWIRANPKRTLILSRIELEITSLTHRETQNLTKGAMPLFAQLSRDNDRLAMEYL